MFYKTHSTHHPILAQITSQKHAISRILHPCTLLFQSIFKKRTCILHHFAFLVCLPTHYFSHPITRFQPLKLHFLTAILSFLAMSLMVRKRFVHTISAYIYTFRLAFSNIFPCVQHQNTLRLAPKRIAFSTKTHCVQHQNALRFVPYCTTFSSKQRKNGCWWRSV